MLTEDSDPAGPAEEQKPAGSFIIFYATSAAKVREIIEGDLFYTENIVSTPCDCYILCVCGGAADETRFAVGQGEDQDQPCFGAGSRFEAVSGRERILRW